MKARQIILLSALLVGTATFSIAIPDPLSLARTLLPGRAELAAATRY